jgi:hypothetical protein
MQRKRTVFFLATLLILAGALVTLENFAVIRGVSFHWPVLLLIVGCGFVLLFFQTEKVDLVLLWLGTFLVILAIFFYYLNWTSWSKLSSLWPFFLGIVGLSFLSVAIFIRKLLFAYFASAFIALFIIFSLVFSVSTKLWPMSFVVFGMSLLILESLHKKMKF